MCAHCNRLATGSVLGNTVAEQSFCFGFKEEAAFYMGLKDDRNFIWEGQDRQVSEGSGQSLGGAGRSLTV